MRPRRAAHPFWRFSLAFYGVAGVERACLELQRARGADVNLLLLCCWLGSRRRSLDKRGLRRIMAAVQPWRSEVIRPLRSARGALKRPRADVPEPWRAYLRREVFRLELDAEYVEQRLLARLAAKCARPRRGQEPQRTAAANLARYLGLLGAAADAASNRRAEILSRSLAARR